jgi:hypothetical protein
MDVADAADKVAEYLTNDEEVADTVRILTSRSIFPGWAAFKRTFHFPLCHLQEEEAIHARRLKIEVERFLYQYFLKISRVQLA